MCDESVKVRKLAEMEDFSEDIISSKPWAKDLLSATLQLSKKGVLNWCNIVSKIGESDLDMDEYISIFLSEIEKIYEVLIADVEITQDRTLDKIEKLLEKMSNLCRDLHVEMPNFPNYQDVPLGELYRLVDQKVAEYEIVAEERRSELRDLQNKLLKLCKSLGKEPTLISESPLPTSNEVEILKARVETLENEALEREEKFFQLKEEIFVIVNELKAPPTLDFENEILNMTNTEVKISDPEMEQLQSYHSRLVNQLTNVREEISELRNKIDNLWDKLETDIAERDAFRVQNTGNSLETLAALKTEVNRLEIIKKANIKVFINKQREELLDLWTRCHCTQEDKNPFTFFYSECYNEDLFELHEREIDKWKSYYEENKEIFGLLQEYKNLWNEHLGLELNSGGATRYKNRGGQLLLEEKMRNKFRKRIPRIEESLIKLSEAYFAHRGRQFKTFGLTIDEYINKLHEDEEKEFKLKLSAKKQQREQTVMTSSRSRMNLFPNSLNPTLTPRAGISNKRKNILAPATEPTKKFKKGSVQKIAKTGLPKLNVSRGKRRSAARLEKLKQRLSFKSKSSQNSNKENDVTGSTSYHDFEKEVSTKNNCRSTGFVLKESSQHLAVPPLTPIKKEFLTPGVTYLHTPRPKRTGK